MEVLAGHPQTTTAVPERYLSCVLEGWRVPLRTLGHNPKLGSPAESTIQRRVSTLASCEKQWGATGI